MRAVLCTTWGEPEDLVVDDIEPPPLLPGSVRISLRAAGVNFADTLAIRGTYQVRGRRPFSPGLEGAGEVLEVAPGVTRVRPGDRITFNAELGAWAEQVVVPEAQVWRVPDTMDWITAGGFSIAYLTSHLALRERARLLPGEWLLVHGAAGGVGLTAVELGRRFGARVIATASTPEKLTLAREYGAEHALLSTAPDLRQAILQATQGHGSDVVYDPVGGDLFDVSLRCVAWGARILTLGFASGRIPQAPCNILLVKNVAVLGHYLGSYRLHAPALMEQSMAELLSWYEMGLLRPHISQVFELAEATQALRLLLSRKSTGKIVLAVDVGRAV